AVSERPVARSAKREGGQGYAADRSKEIEEITECNRKGCFFAELITGEKGTSWSHRATKRLSRSCWRCPIHRKRSSGTKRPSVRACCGVWVQSPAWRLTAHRFPAPTGK